MWMIFTMLMIGLMWINGCSVDDDDDDDDDRTDVN
jgi:hypothetical protein